MSPIARIARPSRPAGLALLVTLIAAPLAHAEPIRPDALRSIVERSKTGVIYDRVLPLAHLERFTGGADAPVADARTWRQAYDELRRSSSVPAGPDLATVEAGARVAVRRDGVIPLALIDRGFERLRSPDDATLVESRAFVAAALAPATYRGGRLEFALDASRCFTDDPPRSLTIDFDDGRGARAVAIGERVQVAYTTPGAHTLRLRATRDDGTVAEARFGFEVAALAAPLPDDTLHVTATIPYQGTFGHGDAYVYKAAGHTALVNPIVLVEGFDFDNDMNWDELYALLNKENLAETLRADGFDLVVLNFADATEAVQTNAFVVTELIQQVQAAIPAPVSLALVGASMGGLCSRYALAYMESHAMPHRVRTWLSFDAPHAGADIPLGMQYWIGFFASQSADAAAFLAILNRPAARQMLIYHLTDPPGTTGQADPMRAAMLADLASIGDYPSLTRRVAIANGSGAGQTQGFAPGNQLVRWEYSSLFNAITGNIWAVPDQVSGTIFQGRIRILFSTTSRTVTVTGTRPWDGSPGGSRASMAELDSIAAPYGDIVALHPSHSFIPTISSLALSTPDPFFDVDGTPNLLALTPFDAVYFPVANQEHVLITPENAAWVRSELEQGVASVPGPGGATASAQLLGGAPNPFSASTLVSFVLPRAGDADVRVFGVDGRQVRHLLHAARSAGRHDVAWDGRDARGARLPAGAYFVRLEAGGAVDTRRVVKLD